MPDITLPEIHLPEVKLPDGLRDMSRQDIQAAISDRLPKKGDLPDVDLSKIDLSKIDLSKIDLSKIDLPKAVEDRLPRRRRSNPILPIAAIFAIGSLAAAAWWLITSPTAMVRVRETADRIRARIGGYEADAEERLETLLPDPNQTRPSVEAETWPDTFSDLGDAVSAGNGSSEGHPVEA
jgi:hypothetical protein